ncbi:integrase catalytic domain-containing protein [Trichonephila clavipes]|nr:integrase catalytic domain-containing protein [Trichonephila clavipes]
MIDPVSLPSDRVKDAAVFEVVGVGLAGPLYVKRGDKVWIVLYTCAIYRALHLELVSSLSTDAFLLSFRRFVARRGRPRIVYSDNGTNFRGAYNELIDINWNKVSRYAEIQRITWKFIPPSADWWGGFRERLVRMVKELLRRTLGKAIFMYEELLTILCECEKVVNSCPLTYLSKDMHDLTPITPARFLFEIPTADTKDLDFRDANHFRKILRFRAKVIEELKRIFRNEYLAQLIQRQKQHPQSSNIQAGDIILIGDDWKKRLQWPLARVIKLISRKDGLVRTVKLKTQSCTLNRPIQRVFPFEVSGNDITNVPFQKVQQTDSSVSCPNPDTLKATDQPQVTRCGRSVKKSDKLNLLTLTDVFD